MRLLRLSYDEMQKLVEGLENEVRAIKKNAFTYGWYMRGSLDIVDAFNMSTEDYEILNEIIENNLETTKKSQMPFF